MSERFDVIVLGAGSGGLAGAQKAAHLGARVALFDPAELGGTCVNRGCVPKKTIWQAAQLANAQKLALDYGFSVTPGKIDWARFRQLRERFISGIRARYAERLDTAGIHVVAEAAHFLDANTVATKSGFRASASHVIIATGAHPRRLNLPGFALGMVSDDMFELDVLPPSIAIVGGGYVAVEFACMLNALGSEVDLFLHGPLLATFDSELVEALAGQMQARGIRFHTDVDILAASGKRDEVTLKDADGRECGPFGALLWAVGRMPNTQRLELAKVGVHCDPQGHILVDAYQNTNIAGITAIGDVTHRKALTPVAVAAGRALAKRLIGGDEAAHFDYALIPSIVFAEPPMGTVGLTEREAREQFGDDVAIHTTRFVPLSLRVAGHEEQSMMKIVSHRASEKVLGIHVFGPGSDELLQGYAVAMRCGLRLDDLRMAVAIHPTAAEELLLPR